MKIDSERIVKEIIVLIITFLFWGILLTNNLSNQGIGFLVLIIIFYILLLKLLYEILE